MPSRVERIRVSQEKLPELATEIIVAGIARGQALGKTATLCLAGGTTPRAGYERLARAAAGAVDWARVAVYFGDERRVAPDHPDSNYRMVRQALLEHVDISASHVHRMEGDNPDGDAAARAYERELPAAFDVLILGIGEDGHTASLFPGSTALAETARRVVPVTAPKPPPDRLTLTPSMLKSAELTLVLASGLGKAAAVARALEGEPDVVRCPAQLVREAVWLTDHAAASALSGTWPA